MCQSLLSKGVLAAEDLLWDVYRIPVEKAIDPLSPVGFVTLQSRLASSLSGAASDSMADVMRKAINSLDVNWSELTDAGRDKIIESAKNAIKGAVPTRVAPAVREQLAINGKSLVSNTKEAMSRKYKLDVQVAFDAVDKQIVSHAASSQALFVRNALGNRIDAYGDKARAIVSSGLEQGLGRYELAKQLGSALSDAGRADSYWQLIAGVFANRSRTYGQLRTMSAAQIDEYAFHAILDSLTSEVCRFMHGRRFTVKHALDRYARVARSSNPEAVLDVQPWLQQGKNAQGQAELYYKQAGQRVPVATVNESGEGEIDRIGSYGNAQSNAELEKAGVSVPPLHGHCRSLILFEESSGGESVAVPEQVAAPLPPLAPVLEAPHPLAAARSAFSDVASAWESETGGAKNYIPDVRAAAVDARKGLRNAIAGLEPEFVSYDVAKQLSWANRMEFDNGLKHTAFHDWDGQVSMPGQPKDYAKALKLAEDGRLLGTPQVEDIRVLLHEELHGHSPVAGNPKAYQGYGASVEEATTEVLARNLTRRTLEKQMKEYPDHAGWTPLELPKVSAAPADPDDKFKNWFKSSYYGSYETPIARIIGHYGAVTGDFEGAAAAVEKAMLKSRRLSPEELIGRDVKSPFDVLSLFTESTGLREGQKAELEKLLTSDKALSEPKWRK